MTSGIKTRVAQQRLCHGLRADTNGCADAMSCADAIGYADATCCADAMGCSDAMGCDGAMGCGRLRRRQAVRTQRVPWVAALTPATQTVPVLGWSRDLLRIHGACRVAYLT